MKWRKKIGFALAIIVVFLALAWGWDVHRNAGTLVPGTTDFRTWFDSDHGMAETEGTFGAEGGGQITVRCWSPGVIQRTKFFDIYLSYPEYPGMSLPGVQIVKLTAGSVNVTFDNVTKCAGCLWINGIPREQLRQIASESEARFDVGNGKILGLHKEQLAQIRALITYTDKLPLFDFPPDSMMTNQINGQ